MFAPYGITVCVEPLGRCFCNFINDLSEAEEIIVRVGAKNLGMVVDFYNMEQNGDADQDLGKYLSVIYMLISQTTLGTRISGTLCGLRKKRSIKIAFAGFMKPDTPGGSR